jgi:2-polyprenyl-6-hydroxyphenyl methylase/3-demethylubiquinone-9 3-methyltransferase
MSINHSDTDLKQSQQDSYSKLSFEFGKNWLSYSNTALNYERIEKYLKDFDALTDGIIFDGAAFIDIGYGQGLGVLAALKKGATVTGIDIDPLNQQAANNILTGYLDEAELKPPTLLTASILDPALVENHRHCYDIVHSWGVLHHTGNLKLALSNTYELVKPNGVIVLAIYNKHWSSLFWLMVKRLYNWMPRLLQTVLLSGFYIPLRVASEFYLRCKGVESGARGMEFMHDLRDWVGGYPYEYMSKSELYASIPPGWKVLRYLPPLVPTGNHQIVLVRASEKE